MSALARHQKKQTKTGGQKSLKTKFQADFSDVSNRIIAFEKGHSYGHILLRCVHSFLNSTFITVHSSQHPEQ